jgi:hypothetical protein
MAKDIVGNTVHAKDKVMFNGMIYTVIEVTESRVLGGQSVGNNKLAGLKLPGSITLQADLPFEEGKLLNMVVIKDPEMENKN